MALRSYKLVKKEINDLKQFYEITMTSYEQMKGILDSRNNHPSIYEQLVENNYIQEEFIKTRIQKKSIKNKTEATLRELLLVRAISALETFLTDVIRDVFLVTKTPFLDRSIYSFKLK